MKLTLSFSICLLFVQCLVAQISIGGRIGLQSSNIEQKDVDEGGLDFKAIRNPQAAIFVEIPINQSFSIQPELMYGVVGSKFEIVNQQEPGSVPGTTLEVSLKGKSRTNILEVPVVGKLKFGSDKMRFFLLAGPSVGFGLNGQSTTEGVIRVIKDNNVIDGGEIKEAATAVFVKDGFAAGTVKAGNYAFPRVSAHLHLGGGFTLAAGRVGIQFDFRFVPGLSDLSPEPDTAPANLQLKDVSRRIMLGLGLVYTIGG
jgi:hypothetical protein